MFGYVIGDSDMITGFRTVGIEGAEVNSVDEACEALNKALVRNDLAIIIVSEEFSTLPEMQEAIGKTRVDRKNTLIVELPGSKGKTSQVRMSDLISKTLGVRI
jgi:vacuolar-type H+-ATPase subunit F/Vma7